MILQFLNALLMVAILASGWLIYGLEHEIRAGERRIAELTEAIAEEEDYTRLLGAEWANLSNPQRIKSLSAMHLPQLQPMKPQQVMQESDIATAIPMRRAGAAVESTDRSISDLLEDLE